MNGTYDIGFAHAVRRAARGVRPKPNVDVTTEGAALAAILRSEGEFDAHGLDLLAKLVTGKLRKIKQPDGETMFAHAVRRAGAAFRKGKDVYPEVEGAVLAEMLRSGQPSLGPGERELLAQLATRSASALQLRELTLDGTPPVGAGHPRVVRAVETLWAKMEDGEVHKNAVLDTAKELGISPRTVEEYEALTKASEKANAAASKLYEP